VRQLESGDRLQRLAGAKRAQRRGVAVDPLLDDFAGCETEFIDAAPVKPRAVDNAGGLPLDDHDVAARGPVEQLPDKIRRGRGLHLTEKGEAVIKHTAKKIRRLYQDKILAGFAGSTADAFTLFSRFESKLEQYHGNLGRGAVELAKDWRTDKYLRHLEALLLVSDKEQTFLLSGQGDVIEPDGGVAAIGSGGPYAQAAAQALAQHTQLTARQIAEEAMKIAGKMCIYTNDAVTIEEL